MKIVTYYGRDYRLLWKGCNSRGEDVVALGHIPPRPGRPRHVPCHAIEAIREEECPPEHAVICPFCRIRNYVLQGRREICKMCGISLADGWDLGTVSHPPQRRPITTRHDIMAVAQRQYPDEVDYDGTPLTYGGPVRGPRDRPAAGSARRSLPSGMAGALIPARHPCQFSRAGACDGIR